MTHKPMLVLGLIFTALVVLSGCSLLPGGGGGNARPTPTLPFPTPIVVNTTAPGQPPAAGQGGVSISGQVFDDANSNGTLDDGEPVIAGVQVQLATGTCPGAPAAQTTSTADTPSYKFDGLAAGDYCVSIDPSSPQNGAVLGQGAWNAPQPAQGAISTAVKLKKQGKDNINFGWTFAALGQATTVTAVPGQPTSVAQQPTAVPPPPGPLPTPTPFVQPTAQPQGCVYRAAYLQDVTVPDNTAMVPGTQFIKTWRVQNTGTCSWGPGSGLANLAFVGGNTLGASNVVPIPNAIPAGATADLSIQMMAPGQSGVYVSNWKLRADNGTLIGFGPYRAPLYAQIRVVNAPPVPTSVPPPTVAPPPGQVTPIVFAPGATEADAQGQLAANGIQRYSLSAQQGQIMQLTLSSNSQSARLAVLSPAGVPLPPQRGNPEGTYWQGTLPATGNYILQILAGNAQPVANFGLNITIPVRITFAPGGISAQVQGTTGEGRVVTYLLKASGGQTMTVNLQAPPNTGGITIYGLDDGQPLIRSQSGATSFTGQLPMTQDYVIQVVPFGNGALNFGLNVTVQ